MSLATVVALLVICLGQGWRLVRDAPRPPWGMLYYEPSLLFAAGKGLVALDDGVAASIPEMAAFLRGDSAAFDPAIIPDGVATHPPDATVNEHKYLFVTLGLCWRLLGISHQAAWMLQYVFLCIAATCIFALCRLFMGRALSFLASCSFVMSPLTGSIMTSSFRDFSRAPFFAAILWLLCMLVRRDHTRTQYLGVAAVLGLAIGLGCGFRADMLIALPLSLPVLWYCRLHRPGARLRITGTALFLAVFFLAGGPVLSGDSNGLFFNAWRAACGLAAPCEDAMQLRFGSYEKLSVFHDDYVYFAAHDSAARGATPILGHLRSIVNAHERPEQDAALVFIAYVWAMARMFPADMVLRIQGATQSILQGIDPGHGWPPLAWIAGWGSLFALLAVAATARKNPRRAFLMVYLLVAFCGYTSIQFHPRHVFHLLFLPYWAVGAATAMAADYTRTQLSETGIWPGKRTDVATKHALAACMSRCLRDFSRVCFHALLILLTLWLVVALPRPLQARRLRGLADAYQAANRECALADTRDMGARTLFLAEPMNACAPLMDEEPFAFQTATYVVRLENVDAYPDLWVEYAPGMYQWNAFNMPVTFRGAGAPEALNVYIRVYEGRQIWTSLWFAGISLPNDQAHFFQGLYRLDDKETGALPLTLALPDDLTRLQPWMRPQYLSHNRHILPKYISPDNYRPGDFLSKDVLNPVNPRHIQAFWAKAREADRHGDHELARDMRLAVLDANADYPAVFRHLLYQLETTATQSTHAALKDLQTARPDMTCLITLGKEWTQNRLARLLTKAIDAREKDEYDVLARLLDQALEIDAALTEATLLYAELLVVQGEADAGVKQLPDIIVQPDYVPSHVVGHVYRNLYERLRDQRHEAASSALLEAALRHYRDALAQTPENLWYSVYSGEILELLGREAEAVEVYEDILRLAPNSPYTEGRLNALRGRMQGCLEE